MVVHLIAVTLGVIVLIIAAYSWWLWRAPQPTAVRPSPADAIGEAIDVIVAVYNERHLLDGKLRNLANLDATHGEVRFLIVDGGSTDGSAEVACEWARHDRRFVALATTHPDKIAQVNAGLRRASAPWIVVSDADARLPRATLRHLSAAARRDPGLTVIGTPVRPVGAHATEQLHWRLSNWLRRQESRRGSASIVVGTCYAFRRSLITQLPADVLADDVYVAWRAAASGGRVGMAAPVVRELRAPRTLTELFRHKVRRGIGVLREVFRFLPDARRMSPAMRIVFLLRAGLFLCGPPIAAAALIVVCASLGRAPSLTGGAVVVATVLMGRALMTGRRALPVWAAVLLLPVLLVAAAGTVLLTYPFSRQTACYPRLTERPDESL